LRHNVARWIAVVEDRQQSMADEALQLQPMLVRFKAAGDSEVFRDIQNERSLLAGDSSAVGKLDHLQRLEEALLRSEKVWALSGSNRRLAAWEPWAEHGRLWEQQKRLLVREQSALVGSVDEFNGMLARWPMSVLLAHSTLMGLAGSLVSDAWQNTLFLARVGLDWTGYGLRRVAALVGSQSPPAPPVWNHRQMVHLADDVAYAQALPTLVFLAGAPLPEGDYKEIQFTREVPADYANVDLGADKAVLENRGAPASYKAVAPKPQLTVVYSAPN